MTTGIRGDDDVVCGGFGCKSVKNFIQLGDELRCNHDPFSTNTTLRPYIRRPKASLTEAERAEEDAKPVGKCSNCHKDIF